ncbi:hypothetical protein CCO03_03660 [Comamonas serinivorans]|uniref:Uncharacterized protein n=1 Tax=Comamonas serinivorans TaxID=1082851 RepID=A0A1Y0EKC8_9BURK|nr:DUF2695 domain-containing protein [Comamonas serinivorans]ARU03900.1 hypothetical protein CCO03_03660 [Comamonas serinivorans]
MTDRERRNALAAQAAAAQAAADEAARADALSTLPCPPAQVLDLFDHLDAVLEQGCDHDWRIGQAWAHTQGVDWPRLQAWLQARSVEGDADDDGESGEVDCDCAVWLSVRPRWGEALRQAAGWLPPRFTLFPALDEVFHAPTPLMACVFVPLLSLDVASLGLGAGRVHAVSTLEAGVAEHDWLEPELGVDHVQFDWDGERYRFRGDLRRLKRLQPLPEWHAEAQAFYQGHRVDAAALAGMLAQQPGPWEALQHWAQQPADERLSYMQRLVNHWLTRDAYRLTGRFLQGGAYLQGHASHAREPHGHLLRTPQACALGPGWQKVGSLVGYHYVERGEDQISLYVSREQGRVVQRLGWT